MEPLAAAARTANVERLAREQFDVLVIGGGITGAGVALDAAARGYSVALVEKVDFASGTSSKSTKLAHGGIRYLPQFDFAMIHEGVVERGLMVRHAPFLRCWPGLRARYRPVDVRLDGWTAQHRPP